MHSPGAYHQDRDGLQSQSNALSQTLGLVPPACPPFSSLPSSLSLSFSKLSELYSEASGTHCTFLS